MNNAIWVGTSTNIYVYDLKTQTLTEPFKGMNLGGIEGCTGYYIYIIVDRLRREFGVEINQGAPQVNYKEAVSYTHLDVYKRQTMPVGMCVRRMAE